MTIFTVAIGILQGFIDWPLIVTSIRWMFRWAEEAPKQKPPEWIYFILLVVGLLWSQAIQIAVAQSVIPEEQRPDGLLSFFQLWVAGRLVGIVGQMLMMAYVHRRKPKAKQKSRTGRSS
jgi:hypothetical protein